jgi:hypothetical protein
MFALELGRAKGFQEAVEEQKNAMTQYVALAVGLTHSRGVNRVMPIESKKAHSKGLAA